MESWDHTIVWSIATLVVFAFRRVWAKKWYYFVVAGIIFLRLCLHTTQESRDIAAFGR
jgi:hypothetical protein